MVYPLFLELAVRLAHVEGVAWKGGPRERSDRRADPAAESTTGKRPQRARDKRRHRAAETLAGAPYKEPQRGIDVLDLSPRLHRPRLTDVEVFGTYLHPGAHVLEIRTLFVSHKDPGSLDRGPEHVVVRRGQRVLERARELTRIPPFLGLLQLGFPSAFEFALPIIASGDGSVREPLETHL